VVKLLWEGGREGGREREGGNGRRIDEHRMEKENDQIH